MYAKHKRNSFLHRTTRLLATFNQNISIVSIYLQTFLAKQLLTSRTPCRLQLKDSFFSDTWLLNETPGKDPTTSPVSSKSTHISSSPQSANISTDDYIYNISTDDFIYNISTDDFIYNISTDDYIYNISTDDYIYR